MLEDFIKMCLISVQIRFIKVSIPKLLMMSLLFDFSDFKVMTNVKYCFSLE